MKKIYSILILSFSVISCGSELDLVPLDTVAEPTFWQTGSDAITGLNGVYNTLADNRMYRNFFMHSDALSNNAFSPDSFAHFLEISEGTGFDANSVLPRDFWNISYEGIGRANEVITKVPEIEMDETLKTRVLAELRFLRALFYFHLTNLYGNVPLVPEIQSLSDALVSREEKKVVVDQVLSDLTFASANLPNSYSGPDVGRITKGAAQALKSRVHLYNGQYSEAISEANKVIALGYDLVSAEDFPNIFLPILENKNSESIFEVQFLSGTGKGVGSGFNGLSDALPEFGRSIFAPLRELADVYDSDDIRLRATVLRPGDEFGGKIYPGTNSQTGFCFKKYVIPDASVTSDGDSNFIVLRYAEVLLNLAEAENELNGPVGAYIPLNRIRNRAGLANLLPGLTKDQMRDTIKLERRKELAFEGHHYFDLLRYGASDLEASMEDVTSVDGHNRVFQSRFVLWPIPQQERNVNSNLTQNPGW